MSQPTSVRLNLKYSNNFNPSHRFHYHFGFLTNNVSLHGEHFGEQYQLYSLADRFRLGSGTKSIYSALLSWQATAFQQVLSC